MNGKHITLHFPSLSKGYFRNYITCPKVERPHILLEIRFIGQKIFCTTTYFVIMRKYNFFIST